MLRAIVLTGAALLAAGAAAAFVATAPRPAFSAADEARLAGGDPARGKVIFDAGQCASCHASPGQPDRRHLGGGLALTTPRGTFRPPNISPHPQDGIGGWTAVEFANAVASGVSPSGQHYYPSLPYTSYTHVEPEDLRDLFAYIRTLAPVAGRPPPHDLLLPLQIRRGIGFWKLLYFRQGPIRPDPARDPAWNRGQYLVESLTHCAECHSARDLAWGVKSQTRFAGGLNPEQVGSAPNITPERIGAWTAEDIAELLRSGRTPDLRVVGATMADVVANTAELPDSDRAAIAAYIKSLPPRPTSEEAKHHRFPAQGASTSLDKTKRAASDGS